MENKESKADIIVWMGSRINWPEAQGVLYWFRNVSILPFCLSMYPKNFGDISQKIKRIFSSSRKQSKLQYLSEWHHISAWTQL